MLNLLSFVFPIICGNFEIFVTLILPIQSLKVVENSGKTLSRKDLLSGMSAAHRRVLFALLRFLRLVVQNEEVGMLVHGWCVMDQDLFLDLDLNLFGVRWKTIWKMTLKFSEFVSRTFSSENQNGIVQFGRCVFANVIPTSKGQKVALDFLI